MSDADCWTEQITCAACKKTSSAEVRSSDGISDITGSVAGFNVARSSLKTTIQCNECEIVVWENENRNYERRPRPTRLRRSQYDQSFD
jgi:hypothetical protein